MYVEVLLKSEKRSHFSEYLKTATHMLHTAVQQIAIQRITNGTMLLRFMRIQSARFDLE